MNDTTHNSEDVKVEKVNPNNAPAKEFDEALQKLSDLDKRVKESDVELVELFKHGRIRVHFSKDTDRVKTHYSNVKIIDFENKFVEY